MNFEANYGFLDLIEVTPDDTVLNETNWKKLFNPEIKDQNVVVFIVYGDSFEITDEVVQFSLHYLYSNFPSIKYPNGAQELLLNPDGTQYKFPNEKLKEFATLSYWSDLFICDKSVILFMKADSRLIHIELTTENSYLFAICSLLASVHFCIADMNLADVHLERFRIAHAYSTSANKMKHAKAYQELLILIKNWESPRKYEFGFAGGEKYLMNINEKNHGCILECLSANFEKLRCYLAPRNVCNLMHIMPQLLPNNGANVKKLNGEQVSLWELMHYTKIICDHVHHGKEIPQFSFHAMMIDSYMRNLVDSCLESYNNLVRLEDLHRIKNTNDIQRIHKESEAVALKTFRDARKLGAPRNVLLFQTELENEIKKSYENWKKVSISLEGLAKFCVLKYKDKITKEGAKDLRISTFVFINHQKYKEEAISMFRESLSSNLHFGTLEEQKQYEMILDQEIEAEFKVWSEISFSMQNIIKSCVSEYLKKFQALSIDRIKNEKDPEKFHEKYKLKVLETFDKTPKTGSAKDYLEYRQNLEADLELEFTNWKEQVDVLMKYFDICVERYKNNTIKPEVTSLWTENDIYEYHKEMKEQVINFFNQNVENYSLKSFFQTELDKKIESHFEYWSQKRMAKIQKILKAGKKEGV